MATEAAAKIVDLVVAELVDCTQEPQPAAVVSLPDSPETSPTQRISEATISTVGADPPPAVTHG